MTALHNELSYRAIRWISNKSTQRGMHTGIEIAIADNYVVDAIAIGDIQNRFCREYNVHSYYDKNARIDDMVFIFESKVSISDFNHTFKENNNSHDNRLKPVANFHWIVAPKGLLKIEFIPSFWGLLEGSGAGLKEIKKPQFQPIENINEVYRLSYYVNRYMWKWGYPDNLAKLKCPTCSLESNNNE